MYLTRPLFFFVPFCSPGIHDAASSLAALCLVFKTFASPRLKMPTKSLANVLESVSFSLYSREETQHNPFLFLNIQKKVKSSKVQKFFFVSYTISFFLCPFFVRLVYTTPRPLSQVVKYHSVQLSQVVFATAYFHILQYQKVFMLLSLH